MLAFEGYTGGFQVPRDKRGEMYATVTCPARSGARPTIVCMRDCLAPREFVNPECLISLLRSMERRITTRLRTNSEETQISQKLPYSAHSDNNRSQANASHRDRTLRRHAPVGCRFTAPCSLAVNHDHRYSLARTCPGPRGAAGRRCPPPARRPGGTVEPRATSSGARKRIFTGLSWRLDPLDQQRGRLGAELVVREPTEDSGGRSRSTNGMSLNPMMETSSGQRRPSSSKAP